MLSDSDRANQLGQATREKLKQFVARIERLEAEKAELAADIREVYAEVKTFGFDTKVMRRVISQRKKETGERAEMEALEALYMDVVEGEVPEDSAPATPAPTVEAIFVDLDQSSQTFMVAKLEPVFVIGNKTYHLQYNNVYKQAS